MSSVHNTHSQTTHLNFCAEKKAAGSFLSTNTQENSCPHEAHTLAFDCSTLVKKVRKGPSTPETNWIRPELPNEFGVNSSTKPFFWFLDELVDKLKNRCEHPPLGTVHWFNLWTNS